MSEWVKTLFTACQPVYSKWYMLVKNASTICPAARGELCELQALLHVQIPCGLLHINKREWCYWNQVAHYWSKVVLPLFQILNSAFPHSDYLWCILAIYALAIAASVNVKSLSDMSQFRLILAVIAFTVQILLAITVSGRVSVPVSDFSASFWLVISDVSRFSWLGRSMLDSLKGGKQCYYQNNYNNTTKNELH